MRVLICGGGVIGASIAYFLSCRGVEAVVVERTGIACAASGKSGGFLALDWCDGTPLEALARRSFALHASLAESIGGDWGYRRLITYGGFASARNGRPSRNAPGVDWLSDSVAVHRRLGSTATTAQVHPGQFTASMMRAAEARGAMLRLGQVTGLVRDAARVKGVEIDGGITKGTRSSLPWGPGRYRRWMAAAAGRLKGHSLVSPGPRSGRGAFSSTRRPAAACTRPRCFRAPTAPPTSAPSPAKARCPSIPAMLLQTRCDRAVAGDVRPAVARACRGEVLADRPAIVR